jgi:hypothetical protein
MHIWKPNKQAFALTLLVESQPNAIHFFRKVECYRYASCTKHTNTWIKIKHQLWKSPQPSKVRIFFLTCIARFSLRRGEQSGNKAKTEWSTKHKNTKNKTNETIYDDQVSQSPQSPLGPTFVLPPKDVALATPARARLSHEHANSSLSITTRWPKGPESRSPYAVTCGPASWQLTTKRNMATPPAVTGDWVRRTTKL